MLAAFLVGPRRVEIRDIKKPDCGNGKILLRMKATSICGSEIKEYRTPKSENLPIVMGHEMAGVVVDKGKDVKKFEIGERVVVQPAFSCGLCQLCSEGRDNLCLDGGMMGRDKLQGGFAEYMVVNAENAFRLPDPIGDLEGTQIQTLATVYHAQRRLQLNPGQSTVIIGLGATGLLHVQLAKASGATPIVGIDLSAPKLELAKKLGADLAIRLPDENALTHIREATRGRGADTVIEAVGIASTVALGIEAVAPGGKILMFGSGHEPLTGFDPFLIYYKEINMIGTRAASKADWQPSIELVESGRISLKPLITHQMAFRDIKAAFALMDEGPPELIRVAVLGAGH